MSRFAGKVAVVTGASKGIGAGIARRLGAEGASVMVNYASGEAEAGRVVAEITGAGGRAVAVGARVGEPEEVRRLFEEAARAFGRVDVLVNNAGVYDLGPLDALSEASYRRHFDTNVYGLLLASQAAPPDGVLYVGTKGAVDAITRSLAKELAPRRVRVNAVNPGLVGTEGTRAAGVIGSEFEAGFTAMTPLGRIGTPEDVAAAVAFLASDEASWITGETLKVAGGFGM